MQQVDGIWDGDDTCRTNRMDYDIKIVLFSPQGVLNLKGDRERILSYQGSYAQHFSCECEVCIGDLRIFVH